VRVDLRETCVSEGVAALVVGVRQGAHSPHRTHAAMSPARDMRVWWNDRPGTFRETRARVRARFSKLGMCLPRVRYRLAAARPFFIDCGFSIGYAATCTDAVNPFARTLRGMRMSDPPCTTISTPIPLPCLPRVLRDRFGLAVTYDHLHRRAMNGTLPIERTDTGRYHATEENLPEIARLLGAAPSTQAAA
jgi:hypothetical protein